MRRARMLTSSHRPARAGFTLVEVLTVVTVVVVLIGLVLAAGQHFYRKSEVDRTQEQLRMLNDAMAEWEQFSDRRITIGDPAAGSYDLEPGWTTDEVALQVMAIITRTESVRDYIAEIDPGLVEEVDASGTPPDPPTSRSFRIRDVWGGRVIAIPAGREWTPNFPVAMKDNDGTIRETYEEQYGIARDRRMLFISPGPDKELGDLREPTDSDEYRQTLDNIYSYDPDVVEPTT